MTESNNSLNTRKELNRRDMLSLLGITAAGTLLSVPAQAVVTSSFQKGAIVRTILKDVPPSALANGTTLFHEHLSATTPYPYAAPTSRPQPPHFSGDVGMMVDEVRAAGKDGVSCIVDGGHPDMGRSMAALKRIATESGVHIVASGGFYTQSAYPPEIASMSEDQIADELVKQARADHLGAFGEIGSSAKMSPDERKVFRAVGKAHLRTGLPIFTHNAYSGSRFPVPPGNALEQVDIFEGLGVDLNHVVIGHLDCQPDVELPKAVAKRGVRVGIDRIGFESMEPDALRVKMVVGLIEAGFTKNIMLSSDFYQPNLLKSNGGPGIGFVVTQFFPKLREAGVSAEALHTISHDNPRYWLAFVPRKTS